RTVPTHHLDRVPRPAPRARAPDSGARLAEADQLRVRARPRREALGPDVQRLEQVRLPRTVRPHDEHEPRLEPEVESRVRAVVAKRDRLDDQPASRIGMMRYVKSSPGEVITAGR